jgi:hypothetical protein
MRGALAGRGTAAKCDEAIVDGRLELVIEDVDREAVADALADLLLTALAREQDVVTATSPKAAS